MARAPIRPITAPRPITPVAAPVDLYIRPTIADRSPLHDLAQGLASVAQGTSSLRSLLEKRQKDQDELDRIRGEAAFNASHQKEYAEAVREGLIPANASPGFVAAYKNAQGNLAGLQLREKFRAEYLAWEGRTDADPEAYGKFVTEFVSRNVGDADPEVLRSLNKHVEQLFSEGYSVFSQERGEATYKGALSTQGALVVETIQGIVADSHMRPEGVDYDSIWSSIVALREEAIASGIRGDHYDKSLAEAIVLEATQTNNVELLGLLGRKLPGSEHAMDAFPEFKELRNRAVETIQSNVRQREIDGDRRQNKIDKQREASILREITKIIADDPNAEVSEEAIRELEKYDPEARKKIVETRKSFLDAEGDEDPRHIMEIMEAVRGGAGEDYLLKKVREGVIRDPKTLQMFQDRVEKYREAKAKGGGLIGTPGAKRYLDSIKREATPSDLLAQDPFGTKGMSEDGLQATHDFEIMLMEWEIENPNATVIEREKAVNEIGQLILGRIDRSGDVPDYVTPDEANQRARETNDRLLREEQAGVAIPNASPNVSAGEAEESTEPFDIHRAYSGDNPPDIGSLPEEYRTSIINEAKRLSRVGITVTPEEYNRAMWSKIRELLLGTQKPGGTAPDGTPIDPTAYRPGEQSPGDSFDRFVQEPGLINDTMSAIEQALGVGEGSVADAMARSASTSQSYAALNPSISQDSLNRLIHIESAGKANAKAPTSTASGLGQFINSTWLSTVKKHRPDLFQGRTQAQVLALRFDPAIAIEMTLRHAEDNAKVLQQSGVPVTDGAIYLAHFAGVGLAAKLLKAPPAASAEKYFSKAAVQANGSIIRGKTVGQVIEWANRKMALAGGNDHIARYMGGGGAPNVQVNPAYANIPDVDGGGRPGQQAKFMEWNPDPIGNHEKVLGSVDQRLAEVVRRAQQYTNVKFVAASGQRTAEQQAKAKEWGWSKTDDSDHNHGAAVDLWIVEPDGTISFDAAKLAEVAKAMKRAAKEVGVVVDWGGDWKSFKDRPHFGLKGVTA